MYYHTFMSKEKVTLTLDSDNLRDLRSIVGARSISETVNSAVSAYLARLRHLKQVDEWLADMDREYGPVPPQTLEWAAKMVAEWESHGERRRRKTG
jgi:hypothetical protein